MKFILFLSGHSPYPLKTWYERSDLAFLQQVSLNKDGRLAITETGRYHIYSQVYFRATRHTRRSQPVTHFVKRLNPGYSSDQQTLLYSSFTMGASHGLFEQTSFVGGTFFLRQGDELSVSVSDLELIHSDAKSTFIGLFKI